METMRKGERLHRALILNGYKLYKQTKAAKKSRDKDSHIFNQGYSTNTNFYPQYWLSNRTWKVSKFHSILEPSKVHLEKKCDFHEALNMIKQRLPRLNWFD